MSRQDRQAKLLEIILSKDVDTQQELTDLLTTAGFSVTQATVSRDIQELGLVKTTGGSGKPHYIKPLDPRLNKLKNLFHQSVLNIDYTGNLVVIKTIAGAANSACTLIDNITHDDIMGTIAGDDTILIIIKNIENVEKIVKLLRGFLEE